MPATSTPYNACNSAIYLADANGNMINVSGMSNEIGLDRTKVVGEFTVFGDQWTYRLDCKRDSSIDLTVIASDDVNGAFDLLNDWFEGTGARRIIVYPKAETIGNLRFDGYFVLQSLNIPLKANEAAPIMVKAALKATGAFATAVATTS